MFGANNGTIYGTPTQLWTQAAYTVWANNSGGSSVAYLNITVVDQLPTIAYSPTDFVLTNNTVSSDLPLVPTLTGPGEITSWAINTSLPGGLSFGTNNGTVWGTPTELWTKTAYLVWANNSGGSSVAYLNITVIDQLPNITYSPADLVLTNNTISTDLPLVPNHDRSGRHNLEGHKRHPASRLELRYQQRYDLWHTNRVVEHHGVHGLGQQHGRFKHGFPQHHRERPGAHQPDVHTREFDHDSQ